VFLQSKCKERTKAFPSPVCLKNIQGKGGVSRTIKSLTKIEEQEKSRGSRKIKGQGGLEKIVGLEKIEGQEKSVDMKNQGTRKIKVPEKSGTRNTKGQEKSGDKNSRDHRCQGLTRKNG